MKTTLERSVRGHQAAGPSAAAIAHPDEKAGDDRDALTCRTGGG
jgi:hypothetical protein